MTEERIETIMRTDFVTLVPETPIRRAAALLVEAGAAVAPVIEDDRLVGLLSQKDCFRPALQASYYREWSGCAADHMTRDVVSVDKEDELIKVAEMFLVYPHRVFAVRDGARLAALLHRSDVLSRLLSLG